MEKVTAFCKRKNIVISATRYGIDALGTMAQGLFFSLLIGIGAAWIIASPLVPPPQNSANLAGARRVICPSPEHFSNLHFFSQ